MRGSVQGGPGPQWLAVINVTGIYAVTLNACMCNRLSEAHNVLLGHRSRHIDPRTINRTIRTVRANPVQLASLYVAKCMLCLEVCNALQSGYSVRLRSVHLAVQCTTKSYPPLHNAQLCQPQRPMHHILIVVVPSIQIRGMLRVADPLQC